MDAVCGDRCPGYECSDSDKEVRSAFWVKGERKVFWDLRIGVGKIWQNEDTPFPIIQI